MVPASGERLLTGWSNGEDAALWTLDEERAGIFTLDVITPVVDDGKKWGEIAAANALSDVFAMGGRPLLALNFVGFPVGCLPLEELRLILQGGQRKVIEAGAILAGGHSIEDQEPKFGLAVYGEVLRRSIWRVTGARPGDGLILTKPLGTGIAIAAMMAQMFEPASGETALEVMSRLNDAPLKLPPSLTEKIHACTDVTGFGLAGHLLDMLSQDTLGCRLDAEALPVLPGVEEAASMGLVPAGAYKNRDLYGGRVQGLDSLHQEKGDLLFDPQTSGGLLLAAADEHIPTLVETLRRCGFSEAVKIGTFFEGSNIEIV